jgi:hypothetical protein
MNQLPWRYLLGIFMGCLGAVLVYWTGAVVALLLLRGIPLGSAGGPPTAAELGIHLLLGTIGGFVGTWAASRVSGSAPPLLAISIALLLGLAAIVAFGSPASNWPRWFGIGMAISCAVGAMGAVGWLGRQ